MSWWILVVAGLLPAALNAGGVDPAGVAALAREKGDSWRQNARDHEVLIGAGPGGRAWLETHSRSTDPRLLQLREELLEQADILLELPILPYRSPEELAKSTGQSLYNTRQELWIGELGDQLVLLSVASALKPGDAALRQRIQVLTLALCRYPHWGAEEPGVCKANQDLAAGHAARGIAIAWAWNRGLWDGDPEEKKLILGTLRERVNVLCDAISGGVYWAGLYQDNHNHINAAGVGIAGAAFLEVLPDDAPRWLAAAKLDFDEVAKRFHADGSSYEGVSYWSYSASFILQFLECTRGILDVDSYYSGDWLRNMAAYRLHASAPGFAGVLPWGDTGARDSSGPQHILNRLAAEYRDTSAQYLAENLPFPPQRGLDVVAWNWLWRDPSVAAIPPVALDGHLTDLDVVDTRSGWGAGDYQLSIKSGHTNRNHSHLDAGAIAFAFGGQWLLPSPGYGSGNGDADFWNFHNADGKPGRRWNYFSNSTESHSTLLVNGRSQLSTQEARGVVRTFVSSPNALWTEVDLRQAYTGVRSIWRRVLHRRGEYILVLDDAMLSADGSLEYLLQLPPDASVEGNTALVRGVAGSLETRLVEPAGITLNPRTPLSPKIDVPATRLKTYAATISAQAGEPIQFRSLLLPRFPGAGVAPTLKRLSEDHFEIQGEDWTDEIQVTGTKSDARLLLVRRSAGEITDVFAVGEEAPSVSKRVEPNPNPAHLLPELPVRSLPPMDPVPASSRIIVEAEDFSEQLYGTCKLSNRPGNHGKSLSGFGQANPLHTLVWKLNVPVGGSWCVRLRFCAALHNTKIALLIDGAAAAPGAREIPLRGTGSWIYSDNWRDQLLVNPDGTLLQLPLPAGEHEIRITQPSSPFNLDRLELVSPTANP